MPQFRVSICCVRLLLGIACCWLAHGAGAQAWDWSYAPSAPLVDAVPAATTASDANGFWSLGQGLVHYRTDGTPDVVRDSRYRESALSVLLPDGGFVFTNQPHVPESGFPEPLPYFCNLRAYSPQGSPRWQTSILQHVAYCQGIVTDAAGVFWVKISGQSDLYRFAADGAALPTFDAQAAADFIAWQPRSSSATVPLDDAGAVLDGVFLVTEAAPSRVIAVDDQLASTVVWTDPDNTHRLQKIMRGNDDNLFVAGRVAGENTSSLVVASITPQGTQRFVQVSSAVPTSTIIAMLPAPDGGIYVLDEQLASDGDALQIAVQHVGGDGTLLWNHVLSGAAACADALPDCGFTVTPQGELLIAARTSSFENRLYRYSTAGTVQLTALTTQRVHALRSRANGDALLSIGLGSAPYERFLELDGSGAEQAAPATQQILDSGFTDAAFLFTDDGSSYVASQAQRSFALTRLDAQGRLLWRNDTVAPGSQLVAGNDLICVDSNTAVTCLSATDGSSRWTQPHTSYDGTPLRILDDGSVEVIMSGGGNYATQLLFDHDGTQLHKVPLPERGVTRIAGNGTVVYLDPGVHNLQGYDRNGVRQFKAAVPAQLVAAYGYYIAPDLMLNADGSSVLTLVNNGGDGSIAYAWALSANGQTRWVTQLGDAQPVSPNGVYSTSAVLGDNGDKVYFLLRAVDAGAPGTYSATVQARSASDGALLWQHKDVSSDATGSDLRLDPASGRLLLSGRYARKLLLTTLDASSGAVVRRNVEPCAVETPASGTYPYISNAYCTWSASAVSADGTLRIGAFANNESAPDLPFAYALRNATATAASVRPQPGADGAWFATYTPGQGFMIDNVSSGIFMPWFTFAPQAGSNGPAQLAWYVLQGGGFTGSPSVPLIIAKADPGQFNSGTVGVHAVGSAQLSFFDCNSALLTYQFADDEAGGAGGTIALTRLTPSTTACRLDDTHTTPAQISNAPAGGFDARLSGSWFDPATAGQGVQFAVVPRGGTFNGLVFGAWFTFDPANNTDDDAHAHWFTLQGDLANASGGKVELPILRTLGGSLDGAPTGNTLQVGHATLTMLGCDAIGADRQQRARLDYVFDDSAVAHAFAGLSGTLNLLRIGGCAL